MIHKPTREAIEELLNDFEAHELIGSRRDVYEVVVSALKDYLAQEEELKRRDCHVVGLSQQITTLDETRRGLQNNLLEVKAENQEWERKCKMLCCRVGVLEMENQALKADIEKHENGYGYLLATGQAEREEMRKRNRRKDQP